MTIEASKPRQPLLYYVQDGDKPSRLVRATSIASALRYVTKSLVVHKAAVEEVATILSNGGAIEDSDQEVSE